MRNHSGSALAAAVFVAVIFLLAVFAQAAPGPSGYHILKTVPIGGKGSWDYCVVDSAARRVYVSHGNHVVVLDADSGVVVGDIPNTLGVHGIALATDLNRGFITAGRANTIIIFDLKTLKTIDTVKARGLNPDAVYYDTGSKRVFAFNGGSANAVAINAADGKVAGMIAVGGKPEFAAGDDKGHVFVVVNADTGEVVATVTIGEDPDAAGYDPDTQLVFSSNGESGDLTVIHQDSADKYTILENVPTSKYARTMAVDFSTHSIFLPFAEFEPVTPKGEEEPPMKPNSFGVLLVGR